ncbi:cell division protein FtsQ/DivIB [Streptomyces chumphonensis]|uniref:cell division protein FtsQ/DivIB n=1 Tax=Streptomyces chumphonensis TaxID=1214925 RepID=UPI003D7660ED
MGGAAGPVAAAEPRSGEPEQSESAKEGPEGRRRWLPGPLRRLRPPRPPRLRPPRLRLPNRRRTRLVLAAALVAVVAASVTWVLYGSSWLRVERVTVQGVRELTEDQVRNAADVPPGEPLAALDAGAVEDRTRRALTRIARIRVERDWPDGVVLRVTERTPEVVMEKPGERGTYIEVDAEGVRYAEVRERPAGAPLVVLDLDASRSNDFFGSARLRTAAVRVATHLPPGARKATRTLRVRSYDSVTLELTGDRTVLWGSAEEGGAKAKVLTALLKAEPDAAHYNVSVPTAPAVSGG